MVISYIRVGHIRSQFLVEALLLSAFGGILTKAILCGVCKTKLTISTYLSVLNCPDCGSAFNEGCRLHTHLCFEVT
ncbi:hypothetical protein ACPPVQ_02805 [Diaminobutyricibacter sp. McL0618]|uniref:hypothetical protein n=1 Tax=Leifsonia sp. McL0618 TaxID=3415677 RepID=UPI003CF80FE3